MSKPTYTKGEVYTPENRLYRYIARDKQIKEEDLTPEMFDFDPRQEIEKYWVIGYSCHPSSCMDQDIESDMTSLAWSALRRQGPNYFQSYSLKLVRVVLCRQIHLYYGKKNQWNSKDQYDDHMDFSHALIKHIKEVLELRKRIKDKKISLNKK